MLACNVSLLRRRASIAAGLAEAAAAADAPGTGNVVFATLVDDPASVGETVDAYLGEIMLEAASADAVVDAFIPATYAAGVVETATAADTQDGTVVILPTTATWDPATVSNVTLSGGNLVATNTTSGNNQGVKVASTSAKTAGKYYFEMTVTIRPSIGGNTGVGVATPASTYTNMGNNATIGSEHFLSSGNIYSNGAFTGMTIGSRSAGDVIGIAIDFDNLKGWFRVAPAGNWNGSGTANPVTNTGGFTIPGGAMAPIITFDGSSGSGNIITANFGASAFTGAVPSGFTSGWPV